VKQRLTTPPRSQGRCGASNQLVGSDVVASHGAVRRVVSPDVAHARRSQTPRGRAGGSYRRGSDLIDTFPRSVTYAHWRDWP
jgi:hypothetical protein